MSGHDVLVIDASAAIAVVLHDDGSEAVDREIRRRTLRGVRLVVPELFWIETANTLGRRHKQPFDVMLEAVATMDRMGLATVRTDRADVLTMMAAMLDHGLSAYDATYLALAESLDAMLLTLDRRLAAAAGARAVDLGLGEMRETQTGYRLEPWIQWPGAAEYFDAVRRITLEEARRQAQEAGTRAHPGQPAEPLSWSAVGTTGHFLAELRHSWDGRPSIEPDVGPIVVRSRDKQAHPGR